MPSSTKNASARNNPPAHDIVVFPGMAMSASLMLFWILFSAYSSLKLFDFVFYIGAVVITPSLGCITFLILQKRVILNTIARAAQSVWLLAIAIISARPSVMAMALASILMLFGICGGFFSERIVTLIRSNYRVRSVVLFMEKMRWAAFASAIIGFVYLLSKNATAYFYWPNSDYPMEKWGFNISEHGPQLERLLGSSAIIFIILVFLMTIRDRMKWPRKNIPLVYIHLWLGFIIAFFTYSFIDPAFFFDYPRISAFFYSHYSAYLGPLNLLRSGAWPLIDVYGQYGLSYVVYAPLGYILPANLVSAALLTNLANISLVMVAVAILVRIASPSAMTLYIAAVFTLFVWMSLPYNLTYTPSVFGVRWLPVWLLILVLVPDRYHSTRLTTTTLVLLNISALWSIETHLVGIIVAGISVALATRLRGASISRSVVRACLVIPLSLMGHIAFGLLTLLFTRRLPDYGPYLEILSAYSSTEGIEWFLLASKFIVVNIWLLFVVVYIAVLFLALSSFTLGRSLLFESRVLVGLSTLTAAGVAEGIYFVGRPTQPLLAILALPLYCLIGCLIALSIEKIRKRAAGLGYILSVLLLLGATSVILGYSWDRLKMDFNGGPMGSSNANLLARCVRFGSCNPVDELETLLCAMRTRTCSSGKTEQESQIKSLTNLYRIYRPQAPMLMLITPMRTPALLILGIQDDLRANNLENDLLSPTLLTRFRQRVREMPSGSIILRGATPSSLEQDLLCEANKKYAFEEVDDDGWTRVDRLIEPDDRFYLGAPVTHDTQGIFLVTRTDSAIPVTQGTSGVVDQVSVVRGAALIHGWVGDSANEVPQIIILSIRDRIAGVTRPSLRADLSTQAHKRRFRHFVCGVTDSDLRTLHVYSVSASGRATELQYTSGIIPGG